MSDEKKGKPAKNVMGNLPSTRPTRMARRRDGEPAANGTAGAREAGGREDQAEGERREGRRRSRRGRRPRPWASWPTKAERKQTATAGPKRTPSPEAAAPKPRAVRSGSPSLDAANKPEADPAPRASSHAAEGRRARDDRRSRRPASWRRSASPSAVRKSAQRTRP